MFDGFLGFNSFSKEKSKYRKLSKRELTDRLIYLEERVYELIKEKADSSKKNVDEFTPLLSKLIDVNNIETKIKLDTSSAIDEKIKEHFNAYHRNGGK